jgi:CpeT protein
MSQFYDFLEGRFENRDQAMKYPTRYAWIIIQHFKIGENRFYGQQAYHYAPERPYRQFVIDIVDEDSQYRLKNYEIDNPPRYTGGKNLLEISENSLTYRDSCDVILTYNKQDNLYTGGTSTCECFVEWQGKKTYLQNDISLGENHYFVMDKGLDCKTGGQIWGSKYGHLKFYRV